ncbi:hypothetical protein QQZ08_009097 [Neonectria magnoliae]|uniref:Uncharacterized protein n=1 Tax=Neonectria magnoliae TaxID=2732573 RepID=A0ABR1HR24_9HYPO
MSGHALVTHLPQLLPSQRLCDITSLEIVWPLKLRQGPRSSAIPEGEPLESILTILSANFPNLTRLHLVLKMSEREFRRVDFRGIFRPVDAIVRSRPGLHQFTISPSRSVFTPFYKALHEELRTKLGVHQISRLPYEVWRNLSGSFVLSQIIPGKGIMSSPYPQPPTPTPGVETVGDGYWILAGNVDDELPQRAVHH